MFRFLRLFIREMLSDVSRFRFFFYLIRNLPGESGFVIREKVLRKRFKVCGKNPRINEGVQIRNIQFMEIGDDVFLGSENFFQAAAGLSIGDNTMLGPGVKIWTQNHKFNDPDKPIAQQGYDFKKVTIGKNVWIGANVFIMPGAEIGAKRIPPYTILAGNPARMIGKREKIEPEENQPES